MITDVLAGRAFDANGLQAEVNSGPGAWVYGIEPIREVQVVNYDELCLIGIIFRHI